MPTTRKPIKFKFTEQHEKILFAIESFERIDSIKLLQKLHQNVTGQSRNAWLNILRMDLKALKREGYLECTNPDTQTYRLSDKGQSFVTAKKLQIQQQHEEE